MKVEDKMSFRELFEEKEFVDVFREIEHFTDDSLCIYNERLKNSTLNRCDLGTTAEEQRELLKEVLYDIGLSVINSTKMVDGKYKEGWDKERAEKAALGYNDSQQTVFLKSSVPTYTITAFWAQGTYNGFEWQPLFRRTDKIERK